MCERGKSFLLVLFIFALCLCSQDSSGNQRDEKEADCEALSGLRWLSGHWTGKFEGMTMEEYWMEPIGGTMPGVHRDVKEGKTIFFEYLRIENTPEGIVYFASPKGGATTSFRLSGEVTQKAVFQNLEHDYPQRIIYQLGARGELHARVEGVVKGKLEFEEWTWYKKK